jgi:hypothetical protein
MCCGDVEVDAIDYWYGQMREWSGKVANLQEQVIKASNGQAASPDNRTSALDKIKGMFTSSSSQNVAQEDPSVNRNDADDDVGIITADKVSGTGLVTFKSKNTQVIACQVPILSEAHPSIRAFPATAPKDTIWENMSSDTTVAARTQTFTSTFLTCGLLFWGAILAFIAAVSTLSNLEAILPPLRSLNPVAKAIISGQLPVIALIVFVSLIPVILTYIMKNVDKRKSESEVEQNVFSWFFAYQVANVLVIVLAGSIIGTVSEAISNPASIVPVLGAALPAVSVFFMNFVITQLLSGTPTIAFRYVPYLIYKVYTRVLYSEAALTRRTLIEGPLAKVTINYGIELPPLLYVLFVMLIYWVMSPILLAISTLFFGATYVGWKYSLLFVVISEVDSGATYFLSLFNFCMTGLMISAITMICYMGIREGAAQAPLMIPLPFIIVFVWRIMEAKFKALSLNLPYSAAVDVDVYGPMLKSLQNNGSSRSMLQKGSSFSKQQATAQPPSGVNSNGDAITTAEPAIVNREAAGGNMNTADGNSDAHYKRFLKDFNMQFNAQEQNPVYPYPYRLGAQKNEHPLLLPSGQLNPVYYSEQEGDKEIASKYVKEGGRESPDDALGANKRFVDVEAGQNPDEEGKDSFKETLLTPQQLAQRVANQQNAMGRQQSHSPSPPPGYEAHPNGNQRTNSAGSTYSDNVGAW